MRHRVFTILVLALTFPLSTAAGVLTDSLSNVQQGGAGYAAADKYSLSRFIGVWIRGFVSLLGTLFIAYLIYGGFKWMSSGGNEEEVTKAKSIIRQAVIGLIIVLSAYLITNFVFKSLGQATAGGN